MGYTRYWEGTSTKYDDATMDIIKEIVNIAKSDYGIIIRGPDGTGDPVISKEYIGLNGDLSNNLEYESFVVPNGTDFGFNFCKTARQPYDIVVNAIMQLLKKKKVIIKCSSDGENEEKQAKALLKKAIKKATKSYILEAYDKDHDVYETLAEHKEVDTLKNIINIITQGKEPCMKNGEPVDWFLISDNNTGNPLWYFDMYESTWKKYKKPPNPDRNAGKE